MKRDTSETSTRRPAIRYQKPATKLALVLLTVRLVSAVPAHAQESAGPAGPFYASDGIAIEGYDPVAYFTQGKPVRGTAEHSLEWSGVTWHFSNRSNRETFRENPDAYAPEYGGYCAYAVSQGSLASIDPQQWTIRDDRLYLNYSFWIKTQFTRSIESHIRSADQNWPELRNRAQ